MSPVEPHTAERIELVVPGRPEYVVVVRLTAAAIAGRIGFSFDDIEDLKVAVGEVCSLAIMDGGPELRVTFSVGPGQLGVEVRHRPGTVGRQPDADEAELNRLLIRVLMDEVSSGADGADQITRLVKRVAAA